MEERARCSDGTETNDGGYPPQPRRSYFLRRRSYPVTTTIPLPKRRRSTVITSKNPSSDSSSSDVVAASAPSSSSPIGKICDGLLVLILQHLPNPRWVLLCKSVCKHWNSLISNPDTLRHLISRQKIKIPADPSSNSELIYFDRPQTHRASILSKFFPRLRNHNDDGLRGRPLQVLACYNDLLLCGRVRSKYRYGTRLFVCNPFTKQCVALPPVPECKSVGYWRLKVRFGTHRAKGSVSDHDVSLIGFVCKPYCSYDDNGSVVQENPRFRVVFMSNAGGIGMMAFHSESWEWKYHDFPYTPSQLMPSTAPYNAITAQSTSMGKLFWKTKEAHVAVFDPFLEDKQIRPVVIDCSHLWSHDMDRNSFLIGASQGFLRGMVFPRPGLAANSKEGSFSVWRLEEDRGAAAAAGYRWSLDYEVSMQTVYHIVRRKPPNENRNEKGIRERRNVMRLGVLGLHPTRAEVVYFEYRDHSKRNNHDPFFFDFEHHFRFDRDDNGQPMDHRRDRAEYDPVYVVPCDVAARKVVGDVVPLAESDATHLKFKYWGRCGVGDPIGWAVFQPVVPFWPTRIAARDDPEEEPLLLQDVEEEDLEDRYSDRRCRRFCAWFQWRSPMAVISTNHGFEMRFLP